MPSANVATWQQRLVVRVPLAVRIPGANDTGTRRFVSSAVCEPLTSSVPMNDASAVVEDAPPTGTVPNAGRC